MEYVGKRIRLIRMDDSNGHDPCVVPPMTTGKVVSVDDIGQLHIEWDNYKSSLAVIPDVDEFEILGDD